MNRDEINRAMELLDEHGKVQMSEIRVGRWVVVSVDGVWGVFDTKNSAISDVRSCVCYVSAKTTRCAAGSYELRVLKEDGQTGEQFYQHYSVYRITKGNFLETLEYQITSLLPEWFFDPYSEEYKVWNGATKGQVQL